MRINVKASFPDGDPVKWWRGKVKRIEDITEAELKQTVEDGRDTMVHMIETRGTGRTWQSPWNGREGSYPGRDDTGHMKNSVSSYLNTTERGNIVARFGWLNNREDYFAYQEGGFEHPAGMTVEGMYALVDSAELVFGELEERLRRGVEGA